jgi:hypothetical protein
VTRAAIRNHLLVVGSVLLVLGLFGTHLGVNYGTWWLLVAVAVVVHVAVFSGLIAWVIRRVRRHREEGTGAAG